MTIPAYITNENIFFDGFTYPCAVFVVGPPKILVRYEALDHQAKQDLEQLVTTNGGLLPFANLDPLHNTVLPNGRTYYQTYVGIFATITQFSEDIAHIWQGLGGSGGSGATGPMGPQGPAGPVGATGPQGPIGLTGAPGPNGIDGIPGLKGDKGDAGTIGPQGPAGVSSGGISGVSDDFTIDEDGKLHLNTTELAHEVAALLPSEDLTNDTDLNIDGSVDLLALFNNAVS